MPPYFCPPHPSRTLLQDWNLICKTGKPQGDSDTFLAANDPKLRLGTCVIQATNSKGEVNVKECQVGCIRGYVPYNLFAVPRDRAVIDCGKVAGGWLWEAGVNTKTECRDIDECAANPCLPEATCRNTPGSFECDCPVSINDVVGWVLTRASLHPMSLSSKQLDI